MRFLLVPGNNSLSHVAKCLALESSLTARGHRVLVAVSRKHAAFLEKRGIEFRILPDIQESDEAGYPTVSWFRRPQRIAECISAEIDLLREFRPDRALGVFRFTLKASAHLAGVPFDSLTCSCMLPGFPEVLGFAPGEEGADLQHRLLLSFFRYAGSKADAALASFGLPPVGDIRAMLVGDRTFLWDVPGFAPLPEGISAVHVGPIDWNEWPRGDIDPDPPSPANRPRAVVTFGTCVASAEAASRVLRTLVDLGFDAVLAAGGQEELMGVATGTPRVTVRRFVPLCSILPRSSLLVCHGGQLTLFEALSREIPILVLPFQPEQAHNGVCLERLGCGRRMVPAQLFRGNPKVYLDALRRTDDRTFRRRIREVLGNPSIKVRLAEFRNVLAKFNGTRTLTSFLETAPTCSPAFS